MRVPLTTPDIGRSQLLTVKDLLEARDAYHVQLSNLSDVVGTAIGFFRWRPGDPYGARLAKDEPKPPRTLANSVVNEHSWPAVLVFVRDWVHRTTFGADGKKGRAASRGPDPSRYVPPYLYLPDGRAARTCIILVQPAPDRSPIDRPLAFPSSLIGGGYPVRTTVQGETRIGTVAGMASDGELVYAITARHVCGRVGQPIESILGGRVETVGDAAREAVRNVPFSRVYPGWPGTDCLVTLDVGLIKVRDQHEWTAQVYGLGELDPPLNLTPEAINLNLIGLPVRAHGAASGKMEGEVQGLFYRYKSIGGIDYVADVLIGPRRRGHSVMTRPGDSGALWTIDTPPDPATCDTLGNGAAPAPRKWTPLAIQWGGSEYLGASPEQRLGFALATFVSTACRTLDVEFVNSWNTGLPEYWGKPVHFRLGFFAWQRIKNRPALASLIEKNLPSLGWDEMKPDDVGDAFGLIDAPDRWAFGSPPVRPLDAGNHCVNLDLSDGQTQLQQWIKKHPTPADWAEFYDRCDTPSGDRGALPFRCGQVFDSLVDSLANGKLDESVFAMGVLGHHVGDAVMPLHLMTDYKGVQYGTPATPSGSLNVHKFYDRLLFERCPEDFTGEVPKALKSLAELTPNKIDGGRAVVEYVLKVMRAAGRHCTQEQLFDAYAEWFNSGVRKRDDESAWAQVGEPLTKAFAEGVRALAVLWTAAWDVAAARPGARLPKPAACDKKALEKRFRDKTFLPSVGLLELDGILGYGNGGKAQPL